LDFEKTTHQSSYLGWCAPSVLPALQAEAKAQQQRQPQQKQLRNPFQGYSQQPDGLQKFLGDTPKVALILMAVAGVGASGFLGNVIGSQAPGNPPIPQPLTTLLLRIFSLADLPSLTIKTATIFSAQHFQTS